MDAFFNPRSIALIGASHNRTKIGYHLWQKIKQSSAKIYPVNPKFKIPNLAAINDPIDLAVIAVPAKVVPEIVSQCEAKPVKAMVVISSGFAERGKTGVALSRPTLPLLGPNCFGLANPAQHFDLTFSKAEPAAGNIGLISQSGALASFLFGWASSQNLGFSKFVSLGNRLRLSENDFLPVLAADPATKVIGLYLESFADGSRWLSLASQISRKKPIVVLMGGQSSAGSQAVLSHTASLSPPTEVIATAISQSGAILANDIDDFTNLLEIFSLEPELTDSDLAIITNAGGPAILATDTASSLALRVAPPIDVLGDATAAVFSAAFNQALKNKKQAAYLIIITPQANTEISKTCQVIVQRFGFLKKPVVVSLLGDKFTQAGSRILEQAGIATIKMPDAAVSALSAMLKFHRGRSLPLYRPLNVPRYSKLSWPNSGRQSWIQAARVAKKYSIPLVKTEVMKSVVKPADFSWPLVMKSDPAETGHRTEAKAIYLNLNNQSALKRAGRLLQSRFDTILLQDQVPAGHELFIGIRREANWPPLLTLGGGGIYTELYRDLARAFLPLNHSQVVKLLKQTRIGQIILGYRNNPKLNLKAVVELILNCSRLIAANPEVSELEINPAIITAERVIVVDLKLVVVC